MDGTEVPLRVLMVGVQRKGLRLPKRVQEVKSYRPQDYQSKRDFDMLPSRYRDVQLTQRPWNNWSPRRESAIVTAVNLIDKLSQKAGNLPNNEYRFWSGCRMEGSRAAVCRGCRKMAQAPHLRKEHMEERKCTDLLVAAYKLLLVDKRCVMCDARTEEQKWGVPLCGNTCVDNWMYTVKRPAPLVAAIELCYTRKLFVPPPPLISPEMEARNQQREY